MSISDVMWAAGFMAFLGVIGAGVLKTGKAALAKTENKLRTLYAIPNINEFVCEEGAGPTAIAVSRLRNSFYLVGETVAQSFNSSNLLKVEISSEHKRITYGRRASKGSFYARTSNISKIIKRVSLKIYLTDKQAPVREILVYQSPFATNEKAGADALSRAVLLQAMLRSLSKQRT